MVTDKLLAIPGVTLTAQNETLMKQINKIGETFSAG